MLHKPENYVNKADFIFGVFDIWILHRYDFLNFVKEHIIILAVVGGFLTEVLSQFNRISVPDIFDFIKCQFNDLIVAYALRFQMILVNIEQQVGFTAAAYSGYYLYHAVIFSADKLVKVLLAFYHRLHHFRQKCVLIQLYRFYYIIPGGRSQYTLIISFRQKCVFIHKFRK